MHLKSSFSCFRLWENIHCAHVNSGNNNLTATVGGSLHLMGEVLICLNWAGEQFRILDLSISAAVPSVDWKNDRGEIK